MRCELGTGGTITTNLGTFHHDLDGVDGVVALEALLRRGEALTPSAAYRLVETAV